MITINYRDKESTKHGPPNSKSYSGEREKKRRKMLIPVCFTGRMLSGIDSYMVKTVIMKTSGGKWFKRCPNFFRPCTTRFLVFWGVHVYIFTSFFVVGSCATYEVQRCTCSSACDDLDKQTKDNNVRFQEGRGRTDHGRQDINFQVFRTPKHV